MSLSNAIVTDALIVVVVIAATASAIWSVAGFTATDLMGVYLYALGYATGRPVPTNIAPPGA